MSDLRPRQQGVALAVGLILLVIMTLLGLSIVRTVTMEEKMTANAYDRSLGFQSAESGLRVAEAFVATNKPNPATTSCNSAGVCPSPNPADTLPKWLNPATVWADPEEGELDLGTLAVMPQYIIEPLNIPAISGIPACTGGCFPCSADINACIHGATTTNCNCRLYRITARAVRVDADEIQTGALVMLQSLFRTAY